MSTEQNSTNKASTNPANLAVLALQLIQARMASNPNLLGDDPDFCDEKPLRDALNIVTRTCRLAAERPPDQVAAWQIFPEDEPMSVEKVASCFKSHGWDGLDTAYHVRKTVEALMEHADRQIQRQKTADELATAGTCRMLANPADLEAWLADRLSVLLRRVWQPLQPEQELLRVSRDAATVALGRIRQMIAGLKTDAARGHLSTSSFAEVFGIDYDTYRGVTHRCKDIDPIDLRNVVWALQDRYSARVSSDVPPSGVMSELESIRSWLGGLSNLGGVQEILTKAIGCLEELKQLAPEGNDPPDEGGNETQERAREALHSDLQVLGEEWAMLMIRRWLSSLEVGPLAEAIRRLLDRLGTENEPTGTREIDRDERERRGELPFCGENVLAWLNGRRASPRNSHVLLDMTSRWRGLEGLLRRRLTEFETCLEELVYCLECPPPGDVSSIHEQLIQIRKNLGIEISGNLPVANGIRNAGADRGKALLDGVCRSCLSITGKIRPYLIFKYAADQRLKKLGETALIRDRSSLKEQSAPPGGAKKRQREKSKDSSRTPP
jgi:hypothetical protein